jgi:serine/threonine-protein kinase
MAEIYIARRVGPHGFAKRIALKRILPQLAADPEFVAMFIDEARVCAQLTHPNLVQVFDFGEEGNELYMAMELVEGTTAAKVVRAAAARREPVPTEISLNIALSVGRGLAHAHEACDEDGRPFGLVHRDVSPGNILISRTGAVKLGDFGIARAAEFERRTEQGQLKGKLGYMSPEQVTGREVDSMSDQFTAGIVLTELLTAHPLFSGRTEMEVLEKIRDVDLVVLDRHGGHVSEDVKSILLRALARRPEDRFPSTAHFVDAMEQVVRRRRLDVRPLRMVEWLQRMDLVKAASRSGEHLIFNIDEDTAPRQSVSPVREMSVPPPRADQQSTPGGVPTVGGAPGLGGARATSARPESTQQPVVRRYSRPESAPSGDVAPAIYRFLLADGARGPFSYPHIAELFATGKLFAHTPVSREGGPFRPAREHADLSRFCSTLATRWDDAIDSGATHRWYLRPTEWPGQVFDLALRRTTGMILVRDGHRQKKAFFVDGVPEFTASTDPKELLGAFLVERGLALPMEIEMGLALTPRYGGRLGDALVGLGILRPMELVRAVVEQIRGRFVELIGWKRGEVVFIPGARAQEETMPEAFPPFELVAKGMLAGYAPDDLTAAIDPIQDAPVAPVARAPVSVASLKLPAREAAVLDHVLGKVTVRQILQESVARGIASRDEAMRAVFIGLSSQLLVCPAWPPTEGRPEAPTLIP